MILISALGEKNKTETKTYFNKQTHKQQQTNKENHINTLRPLGHIVVLSHHNLAVVQLLSFSTDFLTIVLSK